MSTTLSPVTPLAQLRIDTNCPSPSVIRVAVVGEIDLTTVDVLHDGLRHVLSTQIPYRIDVVHRVLDDRFQGISGRRRLGIA